MPFELASLFVAIRANDGPLQGQINGVRSQLSGVAVALGTAAGNLLTSVISGASSSLFGFVSKGIGGATDLAETISKVNAVFGDSASILTGQADVMAAAFGLPKQAILDAAASIGLVGKSAGQSQSEAAAMSNTMAKLAADASSFYNVPMDVALEKIRAGLVGESEPLRAFGVLLSEEAVKNEALAMGLAKSAKEVDNHAKVAARASLIQKGLADASGDLERTADSSANQWRKFTGTLENLAVSIGTALGPAIHAVVGMASDMASGLSAAFESNRGSFAAFAEGVVSWVGTIGVAWRSLPDIWEIVQIKSREMFQNMIASLAVLPENLAVIGGWFANNWVNLIRDGVNAVLSIFSNLGENIYRLGQAIAGWLSNPTGGFHVDFKPLLDGFEATSAKLPEMIRPAFVSLQGEVDAVTGRMADREAARAQGIAQRAQAAAAPAQAAAAEAAKKQEKFKSEQFDTADFYDKLRSSALSGKDDTAAKQLAEQVKTREATEKIAAAVGGGFVARLA